MLATDALKGMKTGGGTGHGGYAIWETRGILSSAALRTVRCATLYAHHMTSLYSGRKLVGEGAYAMAIAVSSMLRSSAQDLGKGYTLHRHLPSRFSLAMIKHSLNIVPGPTIIPTTTASQI